jgi:hypothetical protein
MRRLFAIAVFVLAACAGSADAGDAALPASVLAAEAVACMPAADTTAWLPAPGESLRLAAAGGYGKSCDGARDERWIAEIVNAHGAAFRVQAQPADGSRAKVTLTVYGWVPPRWVRRVYQDGHWQALAEAEGLGTAAVRVDPADDLVPYAIVRVAARAGEHAKALGLMLSR